MARQWRRNDLTETPLRKTFAQEMLPRRVIRHKMWPYFRAQLDLCFLGCAAIERSIISLHFHVLSCSPRSPNSTTLPLYLLTCLGKNGLMNAMNAFQSNFFFFLLLLFSEIHIISGKRRSFLKNELVLLFVVFIC